MTSDEPKKERVIVPPLIEYEEETIHKIYNEIKKFKDKKSEQKCSIFLAEYEYYESINVAKELLKNLKIKKAILNFSIKNVVKDVLQDDGSNTEYDLVFADCKLIPDVFIQRVEEMWKDRKAAIKKLSRNYLNLIRIIEIYFKNTAKFDDKLGICFEQLCEEIQDLLYKNYISDRLKLLYRKPFESLFSAKSELDKEKSTIDKKLNSMYDFYGQINILLNIFILDESIESEKLGSYLDSLESQEKAPAFQIENTGKKKNSKEIIICLSQSGDLYREPKDKFCYPMGEEDDRHKIVRYILSNDGYKQKSEIASIFDGKSEDSIEGEIGRINSISKSRLGLKSDTKNNIIVGKKGSGYRKNPNYKFSFKKE